MLLLLLLRLRLSLRRESASDGALNSLRLECVLGVDGHEEPHGHGLRDGHQLLLRHALAQHGQEELEQRNVNREMQRQRKCAVSP